MQNIIVKHRMRGLILKSFILYIYVVGSAMVVSENCSISERVFVNKDTSLKYMQTNFGFNSAEATYYRESLLNSCTYSNNRVLPFGVCFSNCNMNDACAAFAFEKDVGCQECILELDLNSDSILKHLFIDVAMMQQFQNGQYLIE